VIEIRPGLARDLRPAFIVRWLGGGNGKRRGEREIHFVYDGDGGLHEGEEKSFKGQRSKDEDQNERGDKRELSEAASCKTSLIQRVYDWPKAPKSFNRILIGRMVIAKAALRGWGWAAMRGTRHTALIW
jgi:hypothetical protein